MDAAASSQYDAVGNAKHYETDRINDIVKIERVFGTYEAMIFCEVTEFKYRMRVGKKEGQSLQQELTKASWYAKMATILRVKIGTDKEIKGPNPEECLNPMRNQKS